MTIPPTLIPPTMTAIDPAAPGGPEVLVPVTRPVPVPGDGEVLIRVHAAGVNRPDVLQRLGRYPMPPGAPTIMGLEVAGEVVVASGRWHVGDRVCALVAGGGYAEYCVAPAGQCLPLPEGLDFVAAAGLPETYFTVWSNLFERGGAKAGDTILVHGGTSGIGTTAILLAKAFGIKVIVTAGSPDKCAAARGLGADHAIDYKASDFVDKVAGMTNGRGVDIVLDMVGGDYIPRNLQCLADDGRHVSIALQRGAAAEVNFGLVMARRLTLTGSMLRPRQVAFKTAVAAALEAKVWPLFASGKLRAVSDMTFALADAADAHRRMEAGDHVGKIVLTVVAAAQDQVTA
jgi:putative PIG3 family NAD(P)H quinone oxidoreductase